MKATEIMIGDWVMQTDPIHNGEPMKITEIRSIHTFNNSDIYLICSEDADVYNEYIEPIPLTAEIMEKNFPKPTGEYWVEGDFPIIGYSIPCITDGNRPYVEVSIYDPARVMEFEMFFHYVHELQHALRLCGIEKEIEL